MDEAEFSAQTLDWLKERHRPGNWIAIRPDDEIPAEVMGSSRTILQMFQSRFSPEIEARIKGGRIGGDFWLFAAQLIQSEDTPPFVRLNDEVRGTARVRADRPIAAGAPVLVKDFRHLEGFDLSEDELDCGHFTLLWTTEGWTAVFDFRMGRAKSAEFLKTATEFVSAAKHSHSMGHARACIDNLFSACELISKAHLILHDREIGKSKTHGRVSSAINRWGKYGNVDPDFLAAFNFASNERANARYRIGNDIPLPELKFIETAEVEIKKIRDRVRHLFDE